MHKISTVSVVEKIHTFEQKICIYPNPTYNWVIIILRNEKKILQLHVIYTFTW